MMPYIAQNASASRAGPALPLEDRVEDIPAYDARLMTSAAGTARIVLDGAVYSLRITRQGKLILTK